MRFTKLESAILATLEEAGEDNLAALLNTVGDAGTQQVGNKIDEFGTALSKLIDGGFLELATSRDESSRRWIPLSGPESLQVLRQLDSFFDWSKADKVWVWSSSSPRVEALLTRAGIRAANEVLSQGGWPKSQ